MRRSRTRNRSLPPSGGLRVVRPAGPPAAPAEPAIAFAPAVSIPEAAPGAVRQAIGFARHGKPKDATEVERRIEDPLARKLVEWAILRSDENDADSTRYRAFLTA